MNWQDLVAALGLVFVIEGIIPFINPRRMRQTLVVVLQQKDSTIRVVGLLAMSLGCLLLYLVR